MLFLLTSALAVEAVQSLDVRIFLGGGRWGSVDDRDDGAFEGGVHIIKHTPRRLDREYGLSVCLYETSSSFIFNSVPGFNLYGGLRFSPSLNSPATLDWWVQPYVAGGVGLGVFLIFPMPSTYVALGGRLLLGEQRLDLTLRARQMQWIENPGPSVERSVILVNTLEVGVGF